MTSINPNSPRRIHSPDSLSSAKRQRTSSSPAKGVAATLDSITRNQFPSPSSSSSSSSKPLQKKVIPLTEALKKGYKDLFGVSCVNEYDKNITPVILRALESYKNSDRSDKHARYSKKMTRGKNKLPFTFAFKKLITGELAIEIYGNQNSKLGKGGFSAVKKSYTIVLEDSESGTPQKTVLKRSLKKKDIAGAIKKSIQKYTEVHKKLKQTLPGEKLFLTKPADLRLYAPINKKGEAVRLESSMKRYKMDLLKTLEDLNLSQKEILQILEDAATGTSQLHLLGYVHADIKPENILLNKKRRAKLNDFDHLNDIGVDLGIRDYITLDRLASDYMITPNTDIYALAITMARSLIPNFDENITKHTVTVNGMTSHDGSFDFFGQKLELALSNPLQFIVDCLRGPPKPPGLVAFEEWEQTGQYTLQEKRNKLIQLFPAAMFALNILLREVNNSKRLYEMYLNGKTPKTFTKENWETFRAANGFTSAEKLIGEIQKIKPFIQPRSPASS
jgi:serine/threonine protein kinase